MVTVRSWNNKTFARHKCIHINKFNVIQRSHALCTRRCTQSRWAETASSGSGSGSSQARDERVRVSQTNVLWHVNLFAGVTFPFGQISSGNDCCFPTQSRSRSLSLGRSHAVAWENGFLYWREEEENGNKNVQTRVVEALKIDIKWEMQRHASAFKSSKLKFNGELFAMDGIAQLPPAHTHTHTHTLPNGRHQRHIHICTFVRFRNQPRALKRTHTRRCRSHRR